ncbi:helix-turn-helix domain-containing protein [Mycobacterium sp. Y57]|uniref:helix-turn-helix domain-containing protein n=1 Tax=Mycolicibacterium xanthum TaxID=2796469 RepID=UPI001C85190B|nr:helix-turn-helix domain-containing protein [Mycolicibacterium xanthum]MBX7432963.1 helix-turn-helix domain-containing protein [Mycolicibacterium xanthum]
MARNWREVRAEAIASGRLDPQRAENARKEAEEVVRAHRLAEVRKALGMTRQSDIAERMGVSQARVSKLERGDLSHTELGTLQSYVAALGGELSVTVRIGQDNIELTG